MTKLLDEMIAKVRTWPPERQEDAARMLAAMEQTGITFYRLSDEEREAVLVGLEEAKRGEFVSEEQMAAFWLRHLA